jgi:uncharacterized protein YlaI
MKIYCKLCDKVQPIIIDNCRDAKTNEPFQDIVCKECHLVIAAGTDIQREWVGLMRGVRVEGDTVVITVKGGNEAARELCGELINEMELNT